MADARVVANRFLQLARPEGRPLTPMQLLKLVYIAHGWMLGLNNRPLVDQQIEAWQYGPVIRDLYNATRGYGRSPVAADVWAPAGGLDPQEDDMVRQVYGLYSGMSGPQLSNITHMQGTPWQRTYEPGSFGDVIPNPLIAEHYRRLKQERAAQ